MDWREHEYIQSKLTEKLKRFDKQSTSTDREDAYNRGILAAKAVIKKIFEKEEY